MPVFPAFLKVSGRKVVIIGGNAVAAAKVHALTGAGANVVVIAPAISKAIEAMNVTCHQKEFEPQDLDDAWLVVAAATPAVNRNVAVAADSRHLFVNAVDDPPNASLYLGGVVRRAGVTFAISTDGRAPALAGLLRQALDEMLPDDQLERWLREADLLKREWRMDGVPMHERRPHLLEALIRLYEPLPQEEPQK